MSIFFKRMHDTMNPGEDSIWCPIPEFVRSAIERWQQMLVSAVPVAKLNEKLQIVMMTGLYEFERDLASIINAASRATPAQAMLMKLEARIVNELETALVVTVLCQELIDLHEQLRSVVSYPVDIRGSFSPCVEIARFENLTGSVEGLTEIEAHGITGVQWLVSEIHAGTDLSFCKCGLLGHSPITFSADSVGDKIFEKAAGMSTMDMASGGVLLGVNEFSIDIDDEDEDDEEDEDGWMARALAFTENLEGEY